MTLSKFFHVLIKGTASEVFGIDSETVFRKTVSESRIVTSEKFVEKIFCRIYFDANKILINTTNTTRISVLKSKRAIFCILR